MLKLNELWSAVASIKVHKPENDYVSVSEVGKWPNNKIELIIKTDFNIVTYVLGFNTYEVITTKIGEER